MNSQPAPGTYRNRARRSDGACGAKPSPGAGRLARAMRCGTTALWRHCAVAPLRRLYPASTCCRAVDAVAARAAGGAVGARVGVAVVRHLSVRPACCAACWVEDGFGGVAHLLPVEALVKGSLVALVEDLVRVRFTVGAEVGVTVGVGVQAGAGVGVGWDTLCLVARSRQLVRVC